jgi:hypothetical protein
MDWGMYVLSNVCDLVTICMSLGSFFINFGLFRFWGLEKTATEWFVIIKTEPKGWNEKGFFSKRTKKSFTENCLRNLARNMAKCEGSKIVPKIAENVLKVTICG